MRMMDLKLSDLRNGDRGRDSIVPSDLNRRVCEDRDVEQGGRVGAEGSSNTLGAFTLGNPGYLSELESE